MSETRPFVIRSNTAMRLIGAFAVPVNGGGALLFWIGAHGQGRGAAALLPAALWVPAGTWAMLRVSNLEVDPSAGTVTRREGVLPFARRTRRELREVVDIVEDVVRHKRGRPQREYEFNRLRLVFAGGEEWEVMQEFHTGTKVRAIGERLARLTGLLLTSG